MRAVRKPAVGRWTRSAVQPVDPGSLAALRVALGAVGLLSAVRIVAYGWIDELYAGPSHRFTYLGFSWVPQPGPAAMTILVGLLGLTSVALALGWHVRLAALGLLVAIGWIELIDATTYLNHYWFLTLVAALAVVAPLGAGSGLDARRAGGPTVVARGWVWLFRFQVGVVYAFAGLAKVQGDWLGHALPLRLWLPARADLPVVGPLLAEPATAHVLAVAGAAFDVAIVPLLLWRRTRLPAWLVLVAFHLATWALFPIGVFPWLMIGASTVFFEPDWPTRVRARLSQLLPARSFSVAPRPADPARRAPCGAAAAFRSPLIAAQPLRITQAAAAAWVVVQLALPLRHLAYPGDHHWTGQGYRFAWNVLLTEKAGSVTFLVTDSATGATRAVDPLELYTPTQVRVMAAEPDLVHQVAIAIASRERAAGRDVEVRVDAWASLNGEPATRLIDPTVDLAAQPRDPWTDDWILPRD